MIRALISPSFPSFPCSPLLLCLLSLLGACQTPSGDKDEVCPSALSLHDVNNYSLATSIDITGIALEAPGDPLLDWSGLDEDLRGLPLDPTTGIVTVGVAIFEHLAPELIEETLSTANLDLSEVGTYISSQTGGMSALPLSGLSRSGTDVDIEDAFLPGSGTWLLVLSDSYEPGLGARMLAFLEPTSGAGETSARITRESATLELTADLLRIDPLGAPLGTRGLLFDPTGLLRDARGGAWVTDGVDRVVLARVPDLRLEDIQEAFARIETLADASWAWDFEPGGPIDLSVLANRDNTWQGIEEEGTWFMALTCTRCPNPAPSFLTVLEPCGSAAP